MVTTFSLDPRLAADTLSVGRFALSRLLLMNDASYPWLILVPERPGASELFDLTPADLAVLAGETSLVARMLKGLTGADKINVAALGNVVAQLHVHVIARSEADPAWPGPVWGRAPAKPYAAGDAAALLDRLAAALDALAHASEATPEPSSEARAAAAWMRLAP